jgi:hypothetical protein
LLIVANIALTAPLIVAILSLIGSLLPRSAAAVSAAKTKCWQELKEAV